ncbi:MAG: cell division protein ZapE [Thiotrichales bacterium]
MLKRKDNQSPLSMAASAAPEPGGPQAIYADAVHCGRLEPDPHQTAVVSRLQQLFELLADEPHLMRPHSSTAFHRWFHRSAPPQQIKGLYLWGDVGRGKTHLMDMFYEQIPSEQKLRLHFHRFMALVHEKLEALPGHSDPLHIVARDFAQQARLICLDEFHVEDIGDAMILARLLESLFEMNVVMVMTSNSHPANLYCGGLQRERFLPAIDLIEENTEVLELKGHHDFRRSFLSRLTTWFVPPSDLAERALRNAYHQIAAVERHEDRSDIIVNQRRIPVKRWADGVAWFDFNALCNTPRTASDYAEISSFFHTVLISAIPVMTDEQDDAANRFISLIDELYERNVKLIASAEAKPPALYRGHRLQHAFKRTISRLKEMQSDQYHARRHLS